MMSKVGWALVLETSAHTCSVALFEGGVCRGARSERGGEGTGYVHAEALLPLVDAVHREVGLAPGAIEVVAVSAGPGSYTGLRIGMSTAKGIAHALGRPLVVLDTLELLCHGLGQGAGGSEGAGGAGGVLAVLDARRDEVYAAAFAPREDGGWERTMETQALVLGGMPWGIWTDALPSDLTIVGNAAEKTARALAAHVPGGQFRHVVTCDPEARWAGRLVLEAVERGVFADLAYAEPRYLKEFVAGKPRDLLGNLGAANVPPSQNPKP